MNIYLTLFRRVVEKENCSVVSTELHSTVEQILIGPTLNAEMGDIAVINFHTPLNHAVRQLWSLVLKAAKKSRKMSAVGAPHIKDRWTLF